MYFLYILFAVIFSASAQEFVEPAFVVEPYLEWYVGQRVRRDVTFDKQIGDGKVFGTLGQNDKGLFGKGGYEHQIFNDHRGTLNAQAYGTRVLGPTGDSSNLGGALNWKNPNAAASFDISKQIHGGTSYQAAAGGRWPVGKNGDFSLQGTYGKQPGMSREYGGLGSFNYRW
ncbi:gloverin-like [Danaus plexippus]|uniref:gloverin-like n=1 Tax=Danaus plexippus TaxID=13037 RepID=UPI002AB30612|nr:gloverin-like [Danaus plexippus]